MVVGELAHEKDLVIIGGGPGGYHAAVRAAQLGRKVMLIEKDVLGGVCLNKGCIPSKVFTHAADRLAASRLDEAFGITAEGLHFEIGKLVHYKNQVVAQLRSGVESLCKKHKVEIISGSAFFLSENKLGVEKGDSYEVFSFKEAIIATGSSPVKLAGAPAQHDRVLDPWSIANLSVIPEKLIVLGCDYIALEMAMAFQAFGSSVTLILTESDFAFDESINRELNRVLKKSAISVMKECHYEEMIFTEEEVSVVLSGKNGLATVTGSHLFYSLGTKPNLEGLGIERLGMKVAADGYIITDQSGRTSVSTIFAIGDVTEGPQLAIKAIKQGKVAAETICGQPGENELTFLPQVVRTRPPIACVGLTEQAAIRQGYDVGVGKFPLSGNGYSAVTGRKEGMVKIVFDKKTDLLLGVHLMGEGAVELISSGILALEMAARDEDVKFPAYPHPSLNEALLEAAEALQFERTGNKLAATGISSI